MLLLARSVLSRSCVFSPNASLYKIVSLFVVAAAVAAALVLKNKRICMKLLQLQLGEKSKRNRCDVKVSRSNTK